MSACDSCANYEYDEDYESYICSMDLDEDELYRFMSSDYKDCPYYCLENEYAIVKHQM
ncbi:MAG: DUF6472 family protein [Dorea sp.]|nr:DUF6472 family protein [Dorea sp.]